MGYLKNEYLKQFDVYECFCCERKKYVTFFEVTLSNYNQDKIICYECLKEIEKKNPEFILGIKEFSRK